MLIPGGGGGRRIILGRIVIDFNNDMKPMVKCYVNNIAANALVDTGASNFIIVNRFRCNVPDLEPTNDCVPLMGFGESKEDFLKRVTGSATINEAIAKLKREDVSYFKSLVKKDCEKKGSFVYKGILKFVDNNNFCELLINNIPFVNYTAIEDTYDIIIPYDFLRCFDFEIRGKKDKTPILVIDYKDTNRGNLIAFSKRNDYRVYSVLYQDDVGITDELLEKDMQGSEVSSVHATIEGKKDLVQIMELF